MYNLNDAITALRDADTIVLSSVLTEDEKGSMLRDLLASIPTPFNRGYIATLTEALERLYATYVPAAPARPTEGEQDAAQVASGPGEAAAEASERPTEGLPEQAQYTGGVADSGDSRRASAQASPPAQRSKQGKARK